MTENSKERLLRRRWPLGRSVLLAVYQNQLEFFCCVLSRSAFELGLPEISLDQEDSEEADEPKEAGELKLEDRKKGECGVRTSLSYVVDSHHQIFLAVSPVSAHQYDQV